MVEIPVEALDDLRSLLMAGFAATLLLFFLRDSHCPACSGKHDQ